MAKRINNMNQLQKALIPTMIKMTDTLADRVYEILNHFLQEYYKSYSPKSYRRQFDLLRSAVKVQPKVKGNKVVAYVYIDTDYMDNYYDATGEEVASGANKGLHGGTIEGNHTPHVWDDTVENTVENGELLKLAADYLKSKGISVSVR